MIYLIVGNSGSGKTTQANMLKSRRKFSKLITYTTRSKRPGEQNAVDYFFVDRYEFNRLVREEYFVGIAEYSGNLYGIPKLQLEKYVLSKENIILVIELEGVKEIKKLFPESICIYLNLDKEQMRNRMNIRGDSNKKIEKRLKTAQDFSPYSDYILNADRDVEDIYKDICDIIDKYD